MDTIRLPAFYLPWWMLLATLAGAIAQHKGRSGFAIFLTSLLLSPLVGATVAFLMRWGDHYHGNEAYRQCQACAEHIKKEATICKHCGTRTAPPIE